MTMRSVFLPILLLAMALLATFSFQTSLLLQEREAMVNTRGGQEAPLANAQKFRANLDVLVGETRRLADAGNPHARAILDAFAQRGVRFGPAETKPQPGVAQTQPARP